MRQQTIILINFCTSSFINNAPRRDFVFPETAFVCSFTTADGNDKFYSLQHWPTGQFQTEESRQVVKYARSGRNVRAAKWSSARVCGTKRPEVAQKAGTVVRLSELCATIEGSSKRCVGACQKSSDGIQQQQQNAIIRAIIMQSLLFWLYGCCCCCIGCILKFHQCILFTWQ